MSPTVITRVVAGIEYSLEQSVMLARLGDRDEYGIPNLNRGVYLYCTNRGHYFALYEETEPEMLVRLVPLNRLAALRLYRRLPVHLRDERRAFRSLWAHTDKAP